MAYLSKLTLEIRNKSAAAAQPNPIAIMRAKIPVMIPAAVLSNALRAVIIPLKEMTIRMLNDELILVNYNYVLTLSLIPVFRQFEW